MYGKKIERCIVSFVPLCWYLIHINTRAIKGENFKSSSQEAYLSSPEGGEF
jgi:hypothetical protein